MKMTSPTNGLRGGTNSSKRNSGNRYGLPEQKPLNTIMGAGTNGV